jgi:hypothetical protein
MGMNAPQRLITQINEKQAVMLLHYHEKIQNAKKGKFSICSYFKSKGHQCQYFKVYYEERIKRIFIDKGWTVFTSLVVEEKTH